MLNHKANRIKERRELYKRPRAGLRLDGLAHIIIVRLERNRLTKRATLPKKLILIIQPAIRLGWIKGYALRIFAIYILVLRYTTLALLILEIRATTRLVANI